MLVAEPVEAHSLRCNSNLVRKCFYIDYLIVPNYWPFDKLRDLALEAEYVKQMLVAEPVEAHLYRFVNI